jgi:hypothetical protein
MSSEKNKEYLKKKQADFELKGWNENLYNFDDLCEEHKKVAQHILTTLEETKGDKILFEQLIKTQFQLLGEKEIKKEDNPFIQLIEKEGSYCAIQGYVTEVEDGMLVKYPVVSFIADIRQYEKVYRKILLDVKQFFIDNPEALKIKNTD